MIPPMIMKMQPRTMQGLRPNRSVIVGLRLTISQLAVHSLLQNLHSEHREDGTDSKHIGQETEKVGFGFICSNIIKVFLPVVVLLQEVEE